MVSLLIVLQIFNTALTCLGGTIYSKGALGASDCAKGNYKRLENFNLRG